VITFRGAEAEESASDKRGVSPQGMASTPAEYNENKDGFEDWDFWVRSGRAVHYGRRIAEAFFLLQDSRGQLCRPAPKQLPRIAPKNHPNNKACITKPKSDPCTGIISKAKNEERAACSVSIQF
jgi:hypothetical protein